MRLTTTLAATAMATAALFAAGCGGDDNNSSDGATTQAPAAAETTPSESTTPASDSVAITMKDIQFDPKEQTVKVGTKVTWTNDDSVDHDVVADEGADFKSDTFGQGGTYEFTPESAGTIKYECTLHPGMEGTLQVTN